MQLLAGIRQLEHRQSNAEENIRVLEGEVILKHCRFLKCIQMTLTSEEPMKQSFKENIMLNLIFSDRKKALPRRLIFYGLD